MTDVSLIQFEEREKKKRITSNTYNAEFLKRLILISRLLRGAAICRLKSFASIYPAGKTFCNACSRELG